MATRFSEQSSLPAESSEAELSRNADQEALRSLRSVEIINGHLVPDLSLTTTTQRFLHNLGRAYRGFLVTSKNSDKHVYIDDSVDADKDKFIVLKSDGTVTVSLWVF